MPKLAQILGQSISTREVCNKPRGEVTVLFSTKFLDPLLLPVWRHIVTGMSLGSLVKISKGYDSYLDERGGGKAKKPANIASPATHFSFYGRYTTKKKTQWKICQPSDVFSENPVKDKDSTGSVIEGSEIG